LSVGAPGRLQFLSECFEQLAIAVALGVFDGSHPLESNLRVVDARLPEGASRLDVTLHHGQ
jgi:hypothetical protein